MNPTSIINILVLVIFTLPTLNISLSTNGSSGCIESEKQALLQFKEHLLDPANRLASWVAHEDCCRRWVGVVCDNVSGHVLELHLQNPILDPTTTLLENEAYERSRLGGEIHHSLLNLTHLSYLDLSHNNFGGNPVPDFFGSMARLRFLNFSRAGFGGLIHQQLGWLAGMSQLNYLDMSFVDLSLTWDWLESVNMLPSLKELHLQHCQLLPPVEEFVNLSHNNLSSLVTLNLGGNQLDNTSPTMSWVFSLKTLVSLDLSFNYFVDPLPDGLQNLTSLRHLDLSHNYFNSSIPDWLYGFSPLEFLNLRDNNLQGTISSVIGNMMTNSAISSLDLSGNSELGGGIPKSLGNFCNLKSISLGRVKLSQNISDILQILSLGCISHGLESLDLSNSQLFGQLTGHLGYLKNLRKLDLSYNSIVGSIPESLGELSMLRLLDVSNNKLQGNLPKSFGQLANLEDVRFENNLLKGVLYETHLANLTSLNILYGSGISFILKVHPNWVPPFQVERLKIGSWHLGPQFPPWLRSQKQLTILDISNSGISDSIPSWFWDMSSQFLVLLLNISHNQIYGDFPYIIPSGSFDFSSNSFNGSLPRISSSNLWRIDLSNNSFSDSLSSFLCHRMNETMSLQFLFLSENFLFGELPDCWEKWPNLRVIRLDGNNLVGSIPTSLGHLPFLGSLHLRHNMISGELPHSLQNCTRLVVLDLSENELNGRIPTWLGPSLHELEIMNFHSNKFHGQIPDELCALGSLHILDLSQNNFSGFLPKCIGNFSAMARADNDGNLLYPLVQDNIYSMALFSDYGSYLMKGNLLNYSTTLRLVRFIDLSNNNLFGEIPDEVAILQGLLSLNFSHNHLSGRIPKGIGAMKSLEALDFSGNQLSGSIPQSISNLTFLSYLDLSNNDLIGKIPSGTQISGFPASSFIGNQLCGPPLTKNCSAANGEINPSMRNENKGGDGNGDGVDWFYVAMAIGFGTGFGAFILPLMVSRRWSGIYFQFLDRMWTRILILYAKATRFHAV